MFLERDFLSQMYNDFTPLRLKVTLSLQKEQGWYLAPIPSEDLCDP